MKILSIAFIMSLSLYPMFELTRLIINYGLAYEFSLGLNVELVSIWVMYLAIPFFLLKFKIGGQDDGH